MRAAAEQSPSLQPQKLLELVLPDGLSKREVEVLKLVAKGFTNKDVGKLLHISPKTVAVHLGNVYEKAGCANRTEATAYAYREGIADG